MAGLPNVQYLNQESKVISGILASSSEIIVEYQSPSFRSNEPERIV